MSTGNGCQSTWHYAVSASSRQPNEQVLGSLFFQYDCACVEILISRIFSCLTWWQSCHQVHFVPSRPAVVRFRSDNLGQASIRHLCRKGGFRFPNKWGERIFVWLWRTALPRENLVFSFQAEGLVEISPGQAQRRPGKTKSSLSCTPKGCRSLLLNPTHIVRRTRRHIE